MPTKKKYTDLQFTTAVQECLSIRQVLIQLGLEPKGGNYKTIHKHIKRLNLDTSHFTGMLWSKGRIIGPKQEIEKYLNNELTISSHSLKIRLIKEGLKLHQCESCLLKDWQGYPIAIELDHIDGNNANNNLSNLRILCPNCHAMTSNYRGRNIEGNSSRGIRTKHITKAQDVVKIEKIKIIKPIIQKPMKTCLNCNTEFEIKSSAVNNYCSSECSHKAQQKIEWNKELVEQLLIKHKGNMVQASKEIQISDNGLRKWCKKYDLNPKDYKM